MATDNLSWGANTAKKFFNNLSFELAVEPYSGFHDKILSCPLSGAKIFSPTLTHSIQPKGFSPISARCQYDDQIVKVLVFNILSVYPDQ